MSDKFIIVAEGYPAVKKSLEALGYACIEIAKSLGFDTPVASHTDLFFLKIDDKLFYADNSLTPEIKKHIDNSAVSVGNIDSGYPCETALSVAVLGKNAICNNNNIHKSVISELEHNRYIIHNVKQGYARCSICPVDDNSFITSDVGIYNTLKDAFDILLISEGGIRLDGYAHGFIGGASVRLDKTSVGFFGDISTHPDGDEIISFCNEKGITCISLQSGNLVDIGGAVIL